MSTAHWNYFLSLEKDFIRTLDYVDLLPTNASTVGDNFAKLLLTVGSEVDVVCKSLCVALDHDAKPANIHE